jgi:molybdate/tungstate transport system ATP-binding protein
MTLELADLAKSYPGFELGPIDLAVDREVLSVLGPSGCGKTTLLSLVAGIVHPDRGRIALDGRRLDGRPLEARGVGVVFQEGALFPHMTARENVAYAATGPDRVADLAATLELDGVLDRRPAQLSGGERQRVALARTLAADPDVLLLDEPLSSLDAPIRRRLRDALHDLFRSLDVPIVYVTHDQRSATVLGDRVAVLRDGSVDQVAPPTAILRRPVTEFVARFTGAENVFDAAVVGRTDDGVRLRVGRETLQARTDRSADGAVRACVRPARLAVRAVDAEPPTGENTLPGTARRRLDEGDDSRLVVDVDRADLALTVTVRTAPVGATIERGDRLGISVPPDAIHLLGAAGGDDGAEGSGESDWSG